MRSLLQRRVTLKATGQEVRLADEALPYGLRKRKPRTVPIIIPATRPGGKPSIQSVKRGALTFHSNCKARLKNNEVITAQY